jgi:hypothetical protein
MLNRRQRATLLAIAFSQLAVRVVAAREQRTSTRQHEQVRLTARNLRSIKTVFVLNAAIALPLRQTPSRERLRFDPASVDACQNRLATVDHAYCRPNYSNRHPLTIRRVDGVSVRVERMRPYESPQRGVYEKNQYKSSS